MSQFGPFLPRRPVTARVAIDPERKRGMGLIGVIDNAQ